MISLFCHHGYTAQAQVSQGLPPRVYLTFVLHVMARTSVWSVWNCVFPHKNHYNGTIGGLQPISRDPRDSGVAAMLDDRTVCFVIQHGHHKLPLHVETFSWNLCAMPLQNKFQQVLHPRSPGSGCHSYMYNDAQNIWHLCIHYKCTVK